MKSKDEMQNMLNVMLDEDRPYPERLDAYEYLSEDCEELVDEMLEKLYKLDGDTAKMLIEVLSNYKGNTAIYMGLVSFLYRGEDVALFARLIGSYGDERGIDVLKGFLEEYEPNYNEFMEIRNAVEELGGELESKIDFSDDPFYRYLKGLDESAPYGTSELEDECDECDDECDCDHEHDGCDCDDCDNKHSGCDCEHECCEDDCNCEDNACNREHEHEECGFDGESCEHARKS